MSLRPRSQLGINQIFLSGHSKCQQKTIQKHFLKDQRDKEAAKRYWARHPARKSEVKSHLRSFVGIKLGPQLIYCKTRWHLFYLPHRPREGEKIREAAERKNIYSAHKSIKTKQNSVFLKQQKKTFSTTCFCLLNCNEMSSFTGMNQKL